MAIFPNNRRAFFAFVHDVAMAALSLAAALYLRLGDEAVDYQRDLTITYIVCFSLIAAIVFLITGLYRGIWRYASLPDLFNIARAVTLTVAVFLPVMFVLTRLEALPRSTLLINWFVLIALLGAPRLAYRLFKDRGSRPHSGTRQAPQRPGSADQHEGRRRYLHPRDDARPGCGLPGRRRPRRYAVPGRPGDLPRAGARHDRLARRGRRAARSARPTSAKADHHRAKLLRRADPGAARHAPTPWRSRWPACRGSPTFAATSTAPSG